MSLRGCATVIDLHLYDDHHCITAIRSKARLQKLRENPHKLLAQRQFSRTTPSLSRHARLAVAALPRRVQTGIRVRPDSPNCSMKTPDAHRSGDGPIRRFADQPYLLLSLTSLFWAGNVVVARFVTGHIPPVTLAFLR